MSGKFQLKGHSRVAGLESLNVDGEDQYMPGQKRDVTYVSRLQVSINACFICISIKARGYNTHYNAKRL